MRRPAPAPGPSILELTEQAIREGRHSNTFVTVCEGCNQWVPSIMHVTPDGKRLCLQCAINCGGVKPPESRPQ